MNSKVPAENMPRPECFENTDIARLSLAQDGEWLSVVVPQGVADIGEGFIAQLNESVDLSLGGTLTQQRVQQLTAEQLGRNSALYSQQAVNTRVKTSGYNTFKQLLGMFEPASPYHQLLSAPQFPTCTNLIAMSRLLHEISGDSMGLVTETAAMGRIFLSSAHTIRRKVELLQAHGVDPVSAMIASPRFYMTSDKNPSQFIAKAVRAGSRNISSSVQRTSRANLMDAPLVTQRAEMPAVSEEDDKIYRQLGEVSGIGIDSLTEAFPDIRQLGATAISKLLEQTEELAEEFDVDGKTLRLRDLFRIAATLQSE